MMRTLSLATRNLLRNRRRSLATLLAVAVGAMAILLFGGYRTNIRYSMETAYVRIGGHLQIQHRDFNLYGSGNPTAYGVRGYSKLIEHIQRDEVLKDMVVVATPTLQFGGLAGNYAAGVSKTVLGMGLVADDHERMRQWNHYRIPMVALTLPLAGSPPDAAVVGVGVARVLQLCAELSVSQCPTPSKPAVTATGAALPADIAQLSALEASSKPSAPAAKGARVELLASSARGSPNVAALNVVQAEGQGFKELDDVFIAVHLAQAQRLVFGASEPKATAVVLQLREPRLLPAARARIEAMLPQWADGQTLAVFDFETLNPFFVQSVQLFASIFGFIFTLIGGIVLFTVSNTMNAAVIERTVEVGTLRAMGLRQAGIQRLFLIEGVLLGLAGALVGVLAAVLIAALLDSLGLTWLPPGSAAALPLVFSVWGEWPMIAGVSVGLVLVATLSAWWPAYRAAKLKIVDALRHV
jgi:putative ABC transport system permease protein